MNQFREITPYELEANLFDSIGHKWMLIASQKDGRTNMMTASWGGTGVLWARPVVYAFVRPQRFTKEFIDATDLFSCTFFPDGYREQLTLCGKNSGRDMDKVEATGLTVLEDGGIPYFEQAETAVLCKALYRQPMTPESFLDQGLEQYYPEKDYHDFYVGEIVKVLVK